MKCRYPDVFAAAMLNAQPLGFYAPAQLVRDAREHGVEMTRGRREPVRLGLYAGALLPFPDRSERVRLPGFERGSPERREGASILAMPRWRLRSARRMRCAWA